MIKVTLEGTEIAQRRLQQIAGAIPSDIGAGLHEEAESIMADSKENYVPVDSGTLRGTGHVQPPEVTASGASVTLGYGGPAAPYALAVHENPRSGKTSGTSPSGKPYKSWAKVGQWKYLEAPALQAVRGMGNRLAERIRKLVISRAAG